MRKSPIIAFLLISIHGAFAAGTQPKNFFEVDRNVWRGAALTYGNALWLREQGVKTIIKLNDENPSEEFWGIPVENWHINGLGLNLSYRLVVSILDRIDADAKLGPVYVHCQKGADRTGLIIALYRIKSGWTKAAARTEMNNPRFGHSSLQRWIDHKFEIYGDLLKRKRAAELPIFAP